MLLHERTQSDELNIKSKKIGLKLNKKKTNQNENRKFVVDGTIIKYIEEYFYLRQIIRCGKANQRAKIERCIRSPGLTVSRESRI